MREFLESEDEIFDMHFYGLLRSEWQAKARWSTGRCVSVSSPALPN